MRSRWIGLIGIIGLVIFLFGLIGALLINSFSDPVVSVHLVIGFLALLFWFLLSGLGSLKSWRNIVSQRETRFGFNFLFYTVVFLGLLVVVNIFAVEYDHRWDLTEEKVYSLSDQSQKILKSLKKPLKLVGFITPEVRDKLIFENIFKLYKYYRPDLIQTEIIDPQVKPYLVEKYKMTPGNLIYIEYGDKDKNPAVRINDLSEQSITNAIIKLIRGTAKKIYYVQGHDEPGLDDESEKGVSLFIKSLNDENFVVEGILLAQLDSIPADAAAVLLVSPKKPLLKEEKVMLVKYVNAGGRLLMLTDPRTTDDIKEIADYYGIVVGNNVVIDQIQRLYQGPSLGAQPVVRHYIPHPVTAGFDETKITIFNIASTVGHREEEPQQGVTRSDLLLSSPTAWGETSLALVFDQEQPVAILEKNDLMGPVPMAAAYEKILPPDLPGPGDELPDARYEKAARVVVFGDSDWILNPNLNIYFNRDLALNAVNWLAGEEGGVSIRPRLIKSSSQPVLEETFVLVLITSFIVPELILLFGLFIWWRRKTANM
ncbi:MAG: hypothetical protein D6719_10930 [Candidatus Dadabacteria bacterium]|nr:MAG: hypothetical protein D6719_10930 [Candidatus Dadabacteria bacterium]